MATNRTSAAAIWRFGTVILGNFANVPQFRIFSHRKTLLISCKWCGVVEFPRVFYSFRNAVESTPRASSQCCARAGARGGYNIMGYFIRSCEGIPSVLSKALATRRGAARGRITSSYFLSSLVCLGFSPQRLGILAWYAPKGYVSTVRIDF